LRFDREFEFFSVVGAQESGHVAKKGRVCFCVIEAGREGVVVRLCLIGIQLQVDQFYWLSCVGGRERCKKRM
jgi:hypothetical protein